MKIKEIRGLNGVGDDKPLRLIEVSPTMRDVLAAFDVPRLPDNGWYWLNNRGDAQGPFKSVGEAIDDAVS